MCKHPHHCLVLFSIEKAAISIEIRSIPSILAPLPFIVPPFWIYFGSIFNNRSPIPLSFPLVLHFGSIFIHAQPDQDQLTSMTVNNPFSQLQQADPADHSQRVGALPVCPGGASAAAARHFLD